MNDQIVDDNELGRAAKQIGFLRTIIGGLVAVLLVAFTGGVLWDELRSYEAIVNNQRDQIRTLKDELASLKTNLGDLFEPNYQIEVSNDPEVGNCERGNVVIGVKYDGKKMWIRCASLGRAAWNQSALISTATHKTAN